MKSISTFNVVQEEFNSRACLCANVSLERMFAERGKHEMISVISSYESEW